MSAEKILIVDDADDVRIVLGKKLKAAGYTVFTAECGCEGLDLAKSQLPDLIILDVVMPDMEGGEVLANLKEDDRTKDIPVIFLTSLLSKFEEKEEGNFIGGNITFAKPFKPNEFVAKIQKFLQQKLPTCR